jgi:hypothetical protein
MKYFIMINIHDGTPIPMTIGEEDNDDIALFSNKQAAYRAACQNVLCKACGFIIYKWDKSEAAGNF